MVALKRGVDEDWQTSVQRYPEVLQYFYSLVELSLPGDDDPMVKDPPLSALRHATLRRPSTGASQKGSSSSKGKGTLGETYGAGPSGRRSPPSLVKAPKLSTIKEDVAPTKGKTIDLKVTDEVGGNSRDEVTVQLSNQVGCQTCISREVKVGPCLL